MINRETLWIAIGLIFIITLGLCAWYVENKLQDLENSKFKKYSNLDTEFAHETTAQ